MKKTTYFIFHCILQLLQVLITYDLTFLDENLINIKETDVNSTLKPNSYYSRDSFYNENVKKNSMKNTLSIDSLNENHNNTTVNTMLTITTTVTIFIGLLYVIFQK